MEYRTILTDAGLAAVAAAAQAGDQVQITHLAIGDGGGMEYAPDSAQTSLKNERWRGAVASYTRDGNHFTVTAHMPAETEAFVVRELALFLSDGTCFAVANAPSVPHQPPVNGVGTEFETIMPFAVENADSVTVAVDPTGGIPWSMVGAPNGVAGLGENGAVPIAQGGTGATTAQDAVIALGALLALAAASTYNPSETYTVGDYCTNFGNLYKCSTPIPSGEPWTAEHWTETTVSAELAGKANATPPQETDLPLSSGIGGSAKYFKTQENVGFVFGWITGAQLGSTVATLPVGYFPKYNIITTTSASSNDDTNNSARFRFQTDGQITLEKADDPTALQNGMALVGWYLVSE